MNRAKKIVWIINALLGCVVLMLGISYGILNHNHTTDELNNEMLENSSFGANAPESTKKPETTETKEPETTPTPSSQITSLIFAGDIMLKEGHTTRYDNNGITSIVSEDLVDRFNDADVAMANEEFPFSTRGTPMEDKQYTFRVDPKYVSIFQNLGLDIVSLANNHSLDYGTDALQDSFTTLDAGNIQYAGAGNNLEEAKEIRYIEVNGRKIAFVAASRVIPVTDWNATDSNPGLLTTYDDTMACEQIKEAKKKADYVVIYVHWGIEYSKTPELYQQTMAKNYIDAGADAVIGSHTHCLQGIEYYNGCPIVYSLGNFIFSETIEQTAYVKLTIDPEGEVGLSIYPCKATEFQTNLVTEEEEITAFNSYIESISTGISIDENQNVISTQ